MEEELSMIWNVKMKLQLLFSKHCCKVKKTSAKFTHCCRPADIIACMGEYQWFPFALKLQLLHLLLGSLFQILQVLGGVSILPYSSGQHRTAQVLVQASCMAELGSSERCGLRSVFTESSFLHSSSWSYLSSILHSVFFLTVGLADLQRQ